MSNLFVALRIVCLALFLSGCACVPTQPARSAQSGLHKHALNIRVAFSKRNYFIDIPDTDKPLNSLPVYIVLHGSFSSAKEIISFSGFNVLAEKEKLIVIYPNAAYGFLGFFQHWNAGHCCGQAQKDKTDDVGFLVKVLDDVKARYAISLKKVFLVGFSNGGMLTYRFAAEHSDLVSGAAVISGTIGGRASLGAPYWRIPEPQNPVPLLVFHGIQDNAVPYSGGKRQGSKTEREYDSVETSVNFWIKYNRCHSSPQEEYLLDRRVRKQMWFDSQNVPMVVLYSIDGWGHHWPSDNSVTTNSLPHFNAARIIVDYFKQVSGQ